MFDLLVFIGRFQPFHKEHQKIIDKALTMAENVLVLIGSSGRARSTRNPFTYEERSDMILLSYPEGTNLSTDALHDYPYDDDAWEREVRYLIKENALDIRNNYGFRIHGLEGMKIGIIGVKKDDSSYYIDSFPEYELVELPVEHIIHATDIREEYLLDGRISDVNDTVRKCLYKFMFSDAYAELQEWMSIVEDDRVEWAGSPYPVTKVTVDNFVVNYNKVLLVERGNHPGKGQLALPGGYVNPKERLADAAVRELKEETGLILNPSKKSYVFDHPDRSTMGHVITHAFAHDLSGTIDSSILNSIKGADDAADAFWLKFEDLHEEDFFDDHFHIIKDISSKGFR